MKPSLANLLVQFLFALWLPAHAQSQTPSTPKNISSPPPAAPSHERKAKDPQTIGEVFMDVSDKAYKEILDAARKNKQLVAPTDPASVRVKQIFNRLLPAALKLNPAAKNWRWELNLIKDRQLNAFALEGGKIVLNTGLISAKFTDDQIAFIMAHEMAHALLAHPSRRFEATFNDGLIAAGVGSASLAVRLSARARFNLGLILVGTPYLLNKAYSREHEHEADKHGARIASAAGFSTRAGIESFEKMSARHPDGSVIASWMSTHPRFADRIHKLEAMQPALMGLQSPPPGVRGLP